ncbi:hypothetical protein HK100_001880 [Physocladia obscura]|uniref:Cytochrome b561 domain-containing protein n=1 Tax=Physocladia obscura TaxID=109957 RepID=A0AAD5T830_9FUNG|nr:hypothetical protein HK100_001880 [Physocladia obscura]
MKVERLLLGVAVYSLAAVAVSVLRQCVDDARTLCLGLSHAGGQMDSVVVTLQTRFKLFAAVSFGASSMRTQGEYSVYVGWPTQQQEQSQDNTDKRIDKLAERPVYVSRRTLVGQRMPVFKEEIPQTQTPPAVVATLSPSDFALEFSFPVPTSLLSLAKKQQISCIYAVGGWPSSDVQFLPSADSDFPFHSKKGSFILRDIHALFNLTPSASTIENIDEKIEETVAQDDSVSGTKINYVAIHGYLMTFAWAILTPAAVFTARYLKNSLGHTWYILHKWIFVIGVFTTNIIAFVVLKFAETQSIASTVLTARHNDEPNTFSGIVHKSVGILVVIFGLPLQIILGYVINYLFRQSRTFIPWYDILHHYAGRVISILALLNIFFGLLYYEAFPWVILCYVVYIIGVACAFWYYGEKIHGGAVHHLSDSSKNPNESFIYNPVVNNETDQISDEFEME